jgi:hypothetical protein
MLFVVSAALALAAVLLVLWPRDPQTRAFPQPVPAGDQEVVWLYAATNSAPWERFVTAIKRAQERLSTSDSAHRVDIEEHNAFPDLTTAVPEVVLSSPGKKGRLRFRWYKLTSDLKSPQWVTALLRRRPAPLAIIGGSSSDLAIELAQSLKAEADALQLGDSSPLLLLTMATVDTADEEPGPPETSLNTLYPGRTFRYCFTNRQMASAVTDFIWSQAVLRPDSDPLYLTYWQDDPYSRDLNRRFCDAVRRPAVEAATRDWAWVTAYAAIGGIPVNLECAWWGQFRTMAFESPKVPYSVGMFDRPNRWEQEAARDLLDTKLNRYPDQQRPLLVLPGASGPARRFLRALASISPVEARRFVVATGDAIPFSTVYRDRNVAWPIQDLPFPLVFFCHRNPVDPETGFSPEEAASDETGGDRLASAGTEDLLLYVDIVEGLVQACYQESRLLGNAAALMQQLARLRWERSGGRVRLGDSGQPLFDAEGNRRSGTGEHVVYLRPAFRGEEVLPRATLEVWSWDAQRETGHRWARSVHLRVEYEGAPSQDNRE